VATATHLYNQLDGIEFENMALPTDMRFIPEDEKFTQAPRDSASKVPASYTPPDIWAKVVSNTSYEITWDKTDPTRSALQHDPLSRESISEMKFSEFIENIASSDEDEDDDTTVVEGDGEEEDDSNVSEKKKGKLQKEREKIRAKYAVLLEGISKDEVAEDVKVTFNGLESDTFFDRSKATNTFADDEYDDEMMTAYLDGDGDPGDIDQEITITPGLSDRAEELLKEKEKKNMSSWERYLDKAAEKQKAIKKAKAERRKGYIEEHRAALKGYDPKEKFKKVNKELTEEEKKTKSSTGVAGCQF